MRTKSNVINQYSKGEEIANSVTHGVGIILSISGLTALLVLSAIKGSHSHLISYLIYGFTLILLYTFSTLYHALPGALAKKRLKKLDHIAIYLLIAGTYTPFLVLKLQESMGLWMLIAIWSLAILGVLFKIFFTGRFKLASTLIYIGMGWMSLMAAEHAIVHLSSTEIDYLVGGGFCYTFGTLFYLSKRIPFGHAIWHLFVLLGSIFHFVAVVYTTPYFN